MGVVLSQQQEIEALKCEVEILRSQLSGGGKGSSAAPFVKPNRQQRIGPRLMSLISTLSIAKRMPQRMIQKLLNGLFEVHISIGEINEVLHRVSEWAKPIVVEILRRIRGSPDANADETGWREDGINGYLWSVSTGAERFYYFHRRRAARIIRHILGGKFEGVLGCDFYKGYDWYLGPKQRCWAHLLRDMKKLVEKDASASEWADMVNDIYKAAKKASRRRVDEVDSRADARGAAGEASLGRRALSERQGCAPARAGQTDMPVSAGALHVRGVSECCVQQQRG